MDPISGEVAREGETVRLQVRTLRLLLYLAEHAGEIVSLDDLLKHVWPDVVVSPASVYQAIASLRRVLGDHAKEPTYIVTVPRLGYRMAAAVSREVAPSRTPDPAAEPGSESSPSAATPASGKRPHARGASMWTADAFGVTVGLGLLLLARTIEPPGRTSSGREAAARQKSIAVLPFLDLTEKMSEEEFADGLTEELIDRLSRAPGIRVPPPTTSFSFKNKRRSVAEIASALKVAYVVDGSTRKSGSRLRVAVRLIRADTGAVVWSETFERPWGDVLTVQDDIAIHIAKAMVAAIDSDAQK